MKKFILPLLLLLIIGCGRDPIIAPEVKMDQIKQESDIIKINDIVQINGIVINAYQIPTGCEYTEESPDIQVCSRIDHFGIIVKYGLDQIAYCVFERSPPYTYFWFSQIKKGDKMTIRGEVFHIKEKSIQIEFCQVPDSIEVIK